MKPMSEKKRGKDGQNTGSGWKGKRLLFVIILNFAITAAEVAGGIVSGSLSLISDALHNLSDAFSVVISYFAIRISGRERDEKRTFGYKRATIMAALLNASILIAISALLLREAAERFMHPQAVNGSIVFWVALVGLTANLISVLLLKKRTKGDLNIKSSYLHMLGDTFSSVGVIAGGILIRFFKIYWIDPLITVLISVYILKQTFGVIKSAVNILMQGVPGNIDVARVARDITEIRGIENAHHIHIWSLDEENVNFEAHIDLKENVRVGETEGIKEEIGRLLLEEYGINHTTLQFEYRQLKKESQRG